MGVWLRSVYDRPFHEFQYLMPYTLHVLQGDLLVGECHEGDVLASLKGAPQEY